MCRIKKSATYSNKSATSSETCYRRTLSNVVPSPSLKLRMFRAG